MENYSCIICSRLIEDCGEVIRKDDISIALCGEHMGSCGGNCENCKHSLLCPVSSKRKAL